MNRLHVTLIALVLAVGCSASPSGSDAGPTAQLCIANGLCVTATSPAPPGFGNDYCWNGCNWCTCSAQGTIESCTAQACDAGPLTTDAGTP